MAAWIKMPLGMELGLGPGDFVLDGDLAPLPQKGAEPSPQIFGPCLLSQTAGWIKMVLGVEVGLSPGDFVLDRDPAPCQKGAEPLPNFRPISIVAKLLDGSRWHLIGMEVGLGPGHFVLVGFPAIGERGTAAPLFSAHAYCGHGRQSQLLLSSCSRFFHRYKGN